MSRATLVFDADTTAIARAIAGIPGMVRTAQSQITGLEKAGATERAGVAQGEQRRKSSAEQEAVRAKRRAEHEKSQAEKSAARERSSMAANETRERIAKMRAETEQRAQLVRAATAASVRAERATTAAHAREERSRTETTKREERERARAIAEVRRAIAVGRRAQQPGDGRGQQTRASGLRHAVGAVVLRGALNEHEAMQDARRTRAASNATMAGAVALAGGDVSEVRARQAAVNTFAAAHGFDASQIAEAAAAGQAEFNVLGDRHQTREQRDASFQQFLGNYRTGADTFADPSQHVRLAGMLQQRGITGQVQTQALSVIGAATQAGAIEEGSLTREGMGPLLARMTNARARTGETPQAAQLRALTEAVTEMEVARQAGPSARNSGNVLRGLDQNLRGGVAQDKLLNNLAQSERTAGLSPEQIARARSTLFEADPTRRGHMRLREQFQNGVGLAEGFQAAGLTGQQLVNVTAGGGQGNAQGLRVNERNLLSTLMNGGGIQNIREMQQAGGISQADTERMRLVRESEDATRLQTDAELLLNQRTTGLGTSVSNTIGDFQRLHPAAVGLAEDFTRLGTSVGGWMGMRAMLGYSATTAVAGGAEAAGGTSIAGVVASRGANVGGRLARAATQRIAGAAGFLSEILHPSNEDMRGHTTYFDDAAAIRAHRSSGGSVSEATSAGTRDDLTRASALQLQQAVQRGIEMGMANARVAMDPHTAAHVASSAPPVHP